MVADDGTLLVSDGILSNKRSKNVSRGQGAEWQSGKVTGSSATLQLCNPATLQLCPLQPCTLAPLRYNSAMPKLTLTLFGPFQATVDGKVLTDFATDKIRALLAYLAVAADKPHRREALATLLWPEYSDTIALRNLRQSLHRLRQTLDGVDATLSAALLTVTRQTITLHSHLLQVDTAQFQQQLQEVAAHDHQALHACDHCLATLRAAVDAVQGAFLDGFFVEGAIAFDEWQTIQREHWQQQQLEALRQLTLAYEKRQAYGLMYGFATQLLALAPWREEAHQWAMRALAHSGQRAEALAHYERCREVLLAELGVEPSEATNTLYAQIRRDAFAPTAVQAEPIDMPPALTTATPPRLSGFPQSHGKFLGRSAELTQLTGYLIDPDCRLVTLIGPGGSGKSRLAIEVARHHLHHRACFDDGIRFVALASLTQGALLASTIAAALGVQLHEQRAHDAQLTDFLRDKAILLVLDNFEQILEGATLLGELLATCAALKFLVTSRVALNLRSEQRLTVGGLHYPTAIHPELPPTHLLEHSAPQLFIQAARQVQPDFTADDETLIAIAQICTLVQGMPLALELAATWVRLTDCVTIAREISTNLDFLSITARDLPSRHRSMRAVFAHSWTLIAPSERRLLAQLAIFAGGFSLEAMLAVTDGTVVELANLLDWSLVQRTGQQRYGLHELLRQFAEAELATWPPLATAKGAPLAPTLLTYTRQRHSDYFLATVTQVAATFYGAQPQTAIHFMRRELDNIRAAWQWAVACGNFAALQQASDGLAKFLLLEGLLREGEARFAAAVAETLRPCPAEQESAQQGVRGQLLVQQANFLSYQGKLTEAQPLLREALTCLATGSAEQLAQVHQALGDLLRVKGDYGGASGHLEAALAHYCALGHVRGQAQVLNDIGQLYWAKSDYAQALGYHQQALQLDRQLDHRLGIAQCLSSMGLVYYRQSNYAQALDCHRQALAVAEALGNRHDIAKHASNMGVVYYDQGDFTEATAYLERALSIDRELGNRLGIAKRQTNLGMIYLRTGRYHQALAATQEAYQLLVVMEHQSGIALTLGNSGVIHWHMGDYEQALTYHTAALALDEQLGNRDAQARHLGNLGATHAKLGDLAQALELYERALTLHRALDTRYHWAQTLLRKAEALYLRGDYAAAGVAQREGLAMAHAIQRTDSIFEGELLSAKLAMVQGQQVEAIDQLRRLLQRASSDNEQATVHDELWQATEERFHAQRAVAHYTRLLDRSPTAQYRQRLATLTEAMQR